MNREPTVLERLWAASDLGSTGLILVGAFIAATGRAAGALVMLAGLGVSLGTHLVVGAIAYNRAMTRPWPKVEPSNDDDDW